MARKLRLNLRGREKRTDRPYVNAVLADLDANPGATAEAIAARVDVPPKVAEAVLTRSARFGLVRMLSDHHSMVTYYWTMADYATQFRALVPVAIAWAEDDTNDGRTDDDLATDLGVPQPMAIALLEYLKEHSLIIIAS